MITSERQKFLAAHVTPEVKAALLEESMKRDKSVSRLVYELLVKALRNLGYKV